MRDPISRFASGYAQAIATILHNTKDLGACQGKCQSAGCRIRKKQAALKGSGMVCYHQANVTIPDILAKLEAGTYVNEHFQSQLWRLDAHRKLPGGGFGGIPMHFVGRLETWAESWGQLRDLLNRRLSDGRRNMVAQLYDAMLRPRRVNQRESSIHFKEEIKAHPEWHPRSASPEPCARALICKRGACHPARPQWSLSV